MLLSNTREIAALKLAEKIRETIENLSFIVEQDIEQVTISIGVIASNPKFGDVSSDLLADADRGLYESKSKGRNCVTCIGELGLVSS